jgi:hypothetical protein
LPDSPELKFEMFQSANAAYFCLAHYDCSFHGPHIQFCPSLFEIQTVPIYANNAISLKAQLCTMH